MANGHFKRGTEYRSLPERNSFYIGCGVSIAAFIAAILVSVAFITRAHASGLRSLHIEATIGRSQFSLLADNDWWQSYMPHRERLRSTAWQLGISKTFDAFDGEPYAVGWRVAYVDLGKASNAADWNSDVNFNAGVKSCDPWCAHSTSHWRAMGVSLGPVIEAHVAEVTLGAELGAFLYRSGGQVEYQTTTGRELFADGNTGICDVPYSWHRTNYAGLNVRYKWAYVAFRQYRDIQTETGDKMGLLGGRTNTVTLGVSIPW